MPSILPALAPKEGDTNIGALHAVAELGRHRRPLLRALTAGWAEPEPEHVALVFQ